MAFPERPNRSSPSTFHYGATENHWWQEIVTAWGYLLALKDDPDYTDKAMGDGRSITEHYIRTVQYMKQHMQQGARKGFLTEISSGGYSMRMQNMWHMISAWLYFGVGSVNLVSVKVIGPDSTSLATHYMAMLGGYRPQRAHRTTGQFHFH